MCLASVLNATNVPGKIIVRFENDIPNFGRFYLEQLVSLAHFKGVEVSLHPAKSDGVRVARDFLLDNCRTEYLWMGDDDVVYEYDCLESLYAGMETELFEHKGNISYLCGTKGDVNNRRGYGNFKMEVHGAKDVHTNCPFNWFYDKSACAGQSAEIFTADTGNMLINLPRIRQHGLKFNLFELSLNSGGEDTIFALECRKAGLKAFMIPSARSYHLEKPQLNFSEHAARAEMVLRVCDLREYDKQDVAYMRAVFFPWLDWKNEKEK